MTDEPCPASNIPSKEHSDLYKKVLKGGFWVFALRIFTQGLSIVRLVVLARLLAPEDFGLLGIAMLLIGILETFTTTGFDAALIQKNEDIKPYLNVAWTINILRGIVLFLITFIAASFFAKLKVPTDQVDLARNIIRFMALSLLIKGFTNIGTVYFSKELLFDKRFILGALTNTSTLIVTIIIAVIYRNVWALAIGNVLGSFLGCLLSYYIHPYRPGLSFEFAKAKHLWQFGKWITAGSILSFILTQGDDLFVWGYLGITQLGLYQMAYRISNLPATEITNTISQVAFPAYSKLNGDILRLKQAYLKTLRVTTLLSFLLCLFICLFSPYAIHYLMGTKWDPIQPIVYILIFKGMIRSVGATRGPVLQAIGKPDLLLKFKLFRFFMLLFLLFPLTKYYGILGTAVAILLLCFIGQFPELYALQKLLRIRTGEHAKILVLPYIFLILACILSICIKKKLL